MYSMSVLYNLVFFMLNILLLEVFVSSGISTTIF